MKVNEKVKIVTVYDPEKSFNRPHFLKWNSRTYKTDKVGLHYKSHSGRDLMHHWGLISGGVFFLVTFNTTTLDWVLDEVREDDSC